MSLTSAAAHPACNQWTDHICNGHGPNWILLGIPVVLILAVMGACRSRAKAAPAESSNGTGWLLALLIVIAIGAAVLVGNQKTKPAKPAAVAPKPVPTHTEIVHQITTKVVHSGLPGWGMVVIAVVALGVCCAVFMRGSGS